MELNTLLFENLFLEDVETQQYFLVAMSAMGRLLTSLFSSANSDVVPYRMKSWVCNSGRPGLDAITVG